MELAVLALSSAPVDAQSTEIVERKGLGHPDTLCDALTEEVSLALSRHYLAEHGAILHHNVDKALLWGGRAEPRFRGGRVREPMEFFLAGRATGVGPGASQVEELAREAMGEWLRTHLRHLDVRRHVRLHCLLRPASLDLADLYERGAVGLCPPANDTSCGVGFAPLSELETVVLEAERVLTSGPVRQRHSAFGEDVKVMGARFGERIHLTVACALVDRHLAGPADVLSAKKSLAELVSGRARELTRRSVRVAVNCADDAARGSFYLTVTGTSAEAGDDGEAGRGNRANGLITPHRPMTLESVAGKNPITHVGKLYNLSASLIAEAVVERLPEVSEAECRLVSQIGRSIDDPQLLELRLRPREGSPTAELPRETAAAAAEIARDEIGRVGTLWQELLERRIRLNGWPLRRPDA